MNTNNVRGSKTLADLSAILKLSKRHTAAIRRYDELAELIAERYEDLMLNPDSTAEQCEHLHRLRLRLARRRQRTLDRIVAEQQAWIQGDQLMRTMLEKGSRFPTSLPDGAQRDPAVDRLLRDDSLERLLNTRWPRARLMPV